MGLLTVGPKFTRLACHNAADDARGSSRAAGRRQKSVDSSYRSISAARARAQQQTSRTLLLLSIDRTDRRTLDRFNTLAAYSVKRKRCIYVNELYGVLWLGDVGRQVDLTDDGLSVDRVLAQNVLAVVRVDVRRQVDLLQSASSYRHEQLHVPRNGSPTDSLETASSSIADGPRNVLYQQHNCRTSCTTNPQQIEVAELERRV